ncbi:MAG: hypothetical protein NZM31_14380 [Gemmatales bacterium]|nr:hypothetical protein [Gemmatales bacterium]MDW8388182.1 hypothetical protein [Gemmatales bacterium]
MPIPEAMQIQVSYQRLLEAMTALSRHICNGRADPRWTQELGRLLQTFCDRLTTHYQLLDFDAELQEVEQRAPRLHEKLVNLQREARLIQREATALLRDFDPQKTRVPTALIDRIRTLLKWIEDHEARKNRVVLDAFYTEVGAVD